MPKRTLLTPSIPSSSDASTGECTGERCIETYKVEDDKLYEDVLDRYAGGDQPELCLPTTAWQSVDADP